MNTLGDSLQVYLLIQYSAEFEFGGRGNFFYTPSLKI